MFGLPAVHTYTQQWFGYYFCHIFPYITPWVYPVGMIAQTGSVYLTICVTIERYVAVCLPLKARYLCTFGRAKIYVAGVGFGAVLYNLPRIWEGNQNEIFMNKQCFCQLYSVVCPMSGKRHAETKREGT